MLKLPDAVIRNLGRHAVLGAALLLAACAGQPRPGPGKDPGPAGPGPGPGPTAVAPGVDPAGRVAVALLVPLGSPDAQRNQIGQSLVNAARLAQSDLAGVTIDLRIVETGGEPEKARAAAERAIAEGARIIVGPLFGQEAQAVGPVAAAAGLNVLTFSTAASVAGRNVFLLGQTAETEAARLLDHAQANGVATVAVLHPESPSGLAAAEALASAARRAGVTLTERRGYPRSFQGIQDATRAYAPVHAADALVLPDGGEALVSAAAFLAYNGLTPARTRFMGLGQWNAPATLKEPALRGGWFVAPDPALYETFATRYSAAYGTSPSPIAGLAYDGIAAVGALLRDARAAGDRDPFSVANLTDPEGFAGVTGVFRLRPDGLIDRALAVMEVTDQGFVVRDPAPRQLVRPSA